MRLDKFLWCVRLHKTRSLATEACRKGRVQLNGAEAKPAAEVKVGDEVAVRRPPIWRRFRVLDLPAGRVGAKLVPGLIEDITPLEDLEKEELARRTRPEEAFLRGRPTKQQRRHIDRFRSGSD